MEKKHEKICFFRLDPEVVDRLDAWLAMKRPKQFKGSTVETAIREYLDRQERGNVALD